MRSVAAPHLAVPPATGLGPTAHRLEHVLSFGVAWLAAFRLVGVTVDTVLEPFLATFTTGYVYALAVVLAWLVLVAFRPGASRRALVRSFSTPLRPLALLLALTGGLFLMAGVVHPWISSVAAEMEDAASLGGFLAAGVIRLGELVAFLAVSVALFAILWFGIRSRFRAGEVHPFLPGITDLVVATITLGDALVRPSELFAFTLASAVLLVSFAGADLLLLGRGE